MEKNLYKKLCYIQEKLKAPKNQYNSFGKYKYRSCEDILEGLKPYLAELGLVLNISDDIELIGNRYYIKATAKLIDVETNDFIESYAYAREAESKKGMDSSQVTGATSSYARKYALNGLLCIDDTKDNDFYDNTKNYSKPRKNEVKQHTNTNNKTSKLDEIQNMFDIKNKANISDKELLDKMRNDYGKIATKDLTSEEIKELVDWITQQSFL